MPPPRAIKRPTPRRAGRPKHPIERPTLLRIARAAFAETGYAGTSMSALAARAGLSKASLFHHFPTKEALYHAALEEPVGDLGRLIEQARLDEGSFQVRLDRLSRLVVAYLGTHEAAGALLLRELLDRGPFIQQGGDALVQTVLVAIADFLEAGMEGGAFARQDPRQLALSITGLHLFYFAAGDIAAPYVGTPIHDDDAVAAREAAVIRQVRRLCLSKR